MGIFKSKFPDFILRVLLNISKFDFLHLFVALLQEERFTKGIKHKSFQCEIRATFTKILVDEN